MAQPWILFLHGLDAAPGGFKPKFLESQGHAVLNPALPKESFAESVRIAQAEYDQHQPAVVVGSSRGGAVAMAIDAKDAALVLIAPAWRWFEVAPRLPAHAILLHSENDEVIPIADSRQLLEENDLPAEQLMVVGKNHSMNDAEALAALDRVIRQFMR